MIFYIPKLTYQAKETGFLSNLLVTTKDFGKNPVSDYAYKLKKPGFLLNLSVTTKDFGKNPVSDYAYKLKKPGLQNYTSTAIFCSEASGEFASLGGTTCQNFGKYSAQLARIFAAFLL